MATLRPPAEFRAFLSLLRDRVTSVTAISGDGITFTSPRNYFNETLLSASSSNDI
jgi:hypothetical protein